MTALAVLFMAGAAIGGGALLLRALRVTEDLRPDDRILWSFALGIGVLGWLLFFPTLLNAVSPLTLAAVCGVCLPGLATLHQARALPQTFRPSPVGCFLAAGIALALGFDLLEGLSPPADADSLAYHFTVPKLLLTSGGLFFIPRANDGAVPMLQQLTYMAALGLGGERTLTLWTMLSGWAAAGVLFSITRAHAGTAWALAAALAFLTTPAVIYGGGSGQVETRNAAFVLIAAIAAVRARQKLDWRYAALAGVAAGFYAASKYPGLLFIAACALPLLFQRRWLACGAAYGAAALVAGIQWYAWNAWNTGDPVFPMLFGWLPYSDGVAWDAAHHEYYRTIYQHGEKPVAATLPFLFLYPFQATFSTLEAFESRLVGFGPLPLLLLPAAAVGLWDRRSSLGQSPLAAMALVCFVGYSLWFFLGPSLRVRFHLPLYPILLLCLIVAVSRAAAAMPALRWPIASGLAAALLFQAAVHAVYSLNYAKHLFSAESRSAFLTRNVSYNSGVEWLNTHLGAGNKVAVFNREVNYLLDVPYFYLNTLVDSRIDTRLGAAESAKLWEQLRGQQVTHILTDRSILSSSDASSVGAALAALQNQQCLVEAAVIPSQNITSRTLSAGSGTPIEASVLQLTPETCTVESSLQRRSAP
jgi:hypothetical protein